MNILAKPLGPAARPARSEADWRPQLRLLFVLLQAASILITWPLWQSRANPPLLPVFDQVPQADLGLLLLATLVLVPFKPVAGVVLHVSALLLAFALDQTRIQPEFISLAIILVGTTQVPYARTVARAHLVAMWFWAGLNKALSIGFMGESAQWLFNAFPFSPEFIEPFFGWLILGTEMAIGVFLLVPSLRRAGVVLAVALHLMALMTLMAIGWNESVWPWNVALALAAPYFFWPTSEEERVGTRISVAIFSVLALIPIGFYGGFVDAYIAHNLYTSNTARAEMCQPDGSCSGEEFQQTWDALRVPLPPEPRLFVQYFNAVCSGRERLIVDPRRSLIAFGRDTDQTVHSCPR